MIVHCTQCGTPIERKRYHVAMTQNPFCGFPCYAVWQSIHNKGKGRKRIRVSCANCGSAVERVPSQVRTYNFCSRKCFNQWRSHTGAQSGSNNGGWRGGHENYRGPNWKTQRAAASRRDNDTCQRCGIQGTNFPVHHMRPFRLFADYRVANALDNLTTLCPTCHGVAEQEFWATHPELGNDNPFPITAPIRACRNCGQDFAPSSGAMQVCDACCMANCAFCGQPFYSRKAVYRQVKYCTKTCRNAAIARIGKMCEGCGIVYLPRRAGTRFCTSRCQSTHSNPRRKSSDMT